MKLINKHIATITGGARCICTCYDKVTNKQQIFLTQTERDCELDCYFFDINSIHKCDDIPPNGHIPLMRIIIDSDSVCDDD